MNNHPEITYINLKESVNGKEYISQDYNVYDYFSKKLKVDPYKLCIMLDGEICERDLQFTKINPMSNGQSNRLKMINKKQSTKRFSGSNTQNKNNVSLLQSIRMVNTVQNKQQISQNIQESEQLNQISLLDSIIQHQENQKKRYENLRKTKIHKFLSDSQSILTEMSYDCYICNEKITENSLQTGCKHNFHYSCFEEFVDMQRFQKNTVFNCCCGKQQSLASLFNFFNKLQRGKIIVEEFLINQLNKIKENQNYKFQQCKNCDYFCIPKGQKQNQQFFCPKCND